MAAYERPAWPDYGAKGRARLGELSSRRLRDLRSPRLARRPERPGLVSREAAGCGRFVVARRVSARVRTAHRPGRPPPRGRGCETRCSARRPQSTSTLRSTTTSPSASPIAAEMMVPRAPAPSLTVGSGQRPFLRDAFANELRVDVRRPRDNRRDQDGQCNALGVGRTREITITAAARMTPYTPSIALPLVRTTSGRQPGRDLVEALIAFVLPWCPRV
jgi:hypothetical protein